jgi:hypothetical protein
MPVVLIHLINEDPVMGEMDELPSPSDNLVVVKNPRRKDGKEIYYLDGSVITVFWAVHRINFIEVLPSGEEEAIIGMVRE